MRYSEPTWELKKKIHRLQSKRQKGSQHGPGSAFFQNNWEPTWSCGYEQRIGNIGDGGKWLCDAYSIAEAEVCNIVSIGSNNEWSFEVSIHQLNPRCKIHTFDHTTKNNVINKPQYVNFYGKGLGATNNGDILTMDALLGLAGLSTSNVDVLKIDCEGCEYNVYKELTKGFIRQILMEIHMQTSDGANNIFQHMNKSGYVIFHKESNTVGCQGNCIEYAFLKLNLPK